MNKQHFYCKLIPPRTTFATDLTEAERSIMQQHGNYMRERFAAGQVLLYGPVLASAGAFGLGILQVDDEAEARRLFENDPSVQSGLNRFEIHPMHVAEARGL